MITAWRLVSAARSADAFTGEGSFRYGNRWNHPGTHVVYLASTTSLAALEVLVHAGAPDQLVAFHAFPVSFPAAQILDLAPLPARWRHSPASNATKDAGTAWADSQSSLALRVPSAVVPWEHNYVINVAHPNFEELQIGEPLEFRFDARL